MNPEAPSFVPSSPQLSAMAAPVHPEMDSQLASVLRQVEFYFSDSNLHKDNFLRKLIARDAEGWVPIETIASFNRVLRLTTDIALVVCALRQSQKLVVDPSGLLVRRLEPLPARNARAELRRSIYVWLCPPDASVDSLRVVFESAFGEVAHVKLLQKGDELFDAGDEEEDEVEEEEEAEKETVTEGEKVDNQKKRKDKQAIVEFLNPASVKQCFAAVKADHDVLGGLRVIPLGRHVSNLKQKKRRKKKTFKRDVFNWRKDADDQDEAAQKWQEEKKRQLEREKEKKAAAVDNPVTFKSLKFASQPIKFSQASPGATSPGARGVRMAKGPDGTRGFHEHRPPPPSSPQVDDAENNN